MVKNIQINLWGMSPAEFVKENFNVWTNNYKKSCFESLSEEYKKQSIKDRKLGMNLENLSKAVYSTSQLMKTDISDRHPLPPKRSAHDFAKTFAGTDYFYQREVFNLIKDEMPNNFSEVLNYADKICKICRNHMDNVFEQYY